MSAIKHQIIGFIKYDNQIGLYKADWEAWVLDARAYCLARRKDEKALLERQDARFTPRTMCPARRDDVRAVVQWFDKEAAVEPVDMIKKLSKASYGELDEKFEGFLPVLLYDFDERKAYENPDLNPAYSFDDFLPESWTYEVVEGFDAIVPDVYVYWSRFAAKLSQRSDLA